MDTQGEGARKLLVALAESRDNLQDFAYRLYIQYKARSWTHNLVISGAPFTIYTDEEKEVYERSFLPIVTLKLSSTITIEFSVSLCWNSEGWVVAADIDVSDDDADEADYFKYLWQLPPRRTPDLDEAVAWLADATQQTIHQGKMMDFSHFAPKDVTQV